MLRGWHPADYLLSYRLGLYVGLRLTAPDSISIGETRSLNPRPLRPASDFSQLKAVSDQELSPAKAVESVFAV